MVISQVKQVLTDLTGVDPLVALIIVGGLVACVIAITRSQTEAIKAIMGNSNILSKAAITITFPICSIFGAPTKIDGLAYFGVVLTVSMLGMVSLYFVESQTAEEMS